MRGSQKAKPKAIKRHSALNLRHRLEYASFSSLALMLALKRLVLGVAIEVLIAIQFKGARLIEANHNH